MSVRKDVITLLWGGEAAATVILRIIWRNPRHDNHARRRRDPRGANRVARATASARKAAVRAIDDLRNAVSEAFPKFTPRERPDDFTSSGNERERPGAALVGIR